MKRLIVAVAAAGMLGLAPSIAFSDASSPPECFGQGAAALGQSGPGAVGTFASTAAQGFKGPDNGSIGQTGVPALKATCIL